MRILPRRESVHQVRRFLATLLFALVFSRALDAQSIITTVAGSGRILTGVGGPATSVPLANPLGVAVDSKMNIYVADNTQNVVFRISAAGIATVFAGTGSTGFSGDGGPATAATLTEPNAVAVDAAGNVYIADFHNERIRKVDQSGIITTIAGGGAAFETDEVPAVSQMIFEPSTVAVDAAGDVYFNDGASEIREVTPDGIVHHVAGVNGSFGFSGDGGPAASAQLNGPSGIAFDGKGNLYFADMNNNRVRKIDSNGVISTVAGSGQEGFQGDGGEGIAATSASLFFPSGVAVDAAGNLYIADQYGLSVLKVTPAGLIYTVAGNYSIPVTSLGDGGPATSASLYRPYGIAIDSAGNMYVSDELHRRIRRVNTSGIINTVAGNGITNFAGDGGPATQAALDFPVDVKVDGGGNLYIADSMNQRIRKVTPAGTITTIAGNGTPGFSGDGGAATSAQLNNPVGVAVDSNGNVYITDQANNRIRRVTPGGVISTYAGNGQGGYSGDGGPALNASFFVPGGLATDPAGNLYVADELNNRIRKITPAGIISTVAGNGNPGFSGDGGPATQAMLNSPLYVDVDQAGNLYIVDQSNFRIRKVTSDGKIATVAGCGGCAPTLNLEGVSAIQAALDYSWSIAADSLGNLYLGSGLYVYRVNSAGILTILVGGGLEGYQEGFDGDRGPSVAAHLMVENSPFDNRMGMAVDSAGNLYFADTGNDRIRKVTNANSPAQLVIENLDFPLPSFPYPPTGGDQQDFNLYPVSQRLAVSNAGTGTMEFDATTSTLAGGNWLQISSSSGSAPSTLTLSSATNLGPGYYLGTVLFSAPSASNSPRYVSGSLTVPIPYLSAGANSATFFVTEPAGVGWYASSNVSWMTISSQANGSGIGMIGYSVAANTGVAQRTGTLTIAGVPVTVTQAAGNANAPSTASAITPGGIVPVYSTVGTIQPGEWVSIYGTNLASSTVTWDGTFPTSLGGTTVTINGKAAYLAYVSPSQIDLQTPMDDATGPVTVVVTTGGVSATSIVTLAQFAPSFCLLDNKHVAGLILRPDGSGAYGGGAYDILGPTGNSLGYPTVAARAGDQIELFAVGLGPTDPAVPPGQAFSGAAPTTNPVNLFIDGVDVLPTFAGLSSAGLYQINLTLPPGLGTGDVPLQATVGGAQTQAGVVISVQ